VVKCPKCGEEINLLENRTKTEKGYYFRLDGKGHPDWIDMELGNSYDPLFPLREIYMCPKCKEILFEDNDEAIKFLKGGSC